MIRLLSNRLAARDGFVNKLACVGALVAVVLGAPLARVQARSPYQTSWGTDGPIIAGTGVIGVAALLLAPEVQPLTPDQVAALSPDDVNPFDRGATHNYSEASSTASDWLVYGLIASPLLLLSQTEVRDDWETYVAMYAETMALTGAAAQLAKGSLTRTRPFVYNPEAPMDPKLDAEAQKSFYSSHSAYAFASAVFLSTTFDDYFPSSPARAYIWAGSLTIATTVGVLRYTAGEHFPTDILVGAVMGSAVGYLIPLVHRIDTGSLSAVPSSTGGAAGVVFRLRF